MDMGCDVRAPRAFREWIWVFGRFRREPRVDTWERLARRELFWAYSACNFVPWWWKADAVQVDRASARAQLGFSRAIDRREGFWAARLGSRREDFWVAVAYLNQTLTSVGSC